MKPDTYKPPPQFTQDTETYKHTFRCRNCNTDNDREIPNGTPIRLVPVVCDYCGCRIETGW